MPAKIKAIPKFGEPPADGLVIDVTSHSTDVGRGFSPFFLGPCPLYGGYMSQTMEAGWQFAKVFAQHVDRDCNPTSAYWAWATAGWRNPKAVRYPMGKGAKPLYSLWDGHRLDYIEARRRIYLPLYIRAVLETTAGNQAWRQLLKWREEHDKIYLRDFDGYDHEAQGLDLSGVLHNTARPMGHGFAILLMVTAFDKGARTTAEMVGTVPARKSTSLF